jgi:hypothetical protein
MPYRPSWPEFIVFMAALVLPPILLERWYGLNWWLMLALTAAIVVPLFWLYLRIRERKLGLLLTSFSSFVGRLFGG